LKCQWPWIDIDIDAIDPKAFAHCLLVLERLASVWPEPFTALKAIKSAPESAS
jgi:hypothetical protein